MRRNSIALTFPKDFFKDYAREQPCMIRVAAACGYQCSTGETSVLCHPSVAGLKAMGSRAASVPDIGAAWGCNVCHDLVDRRLAPVVGSPAALLMAAQSGTYIGATDGASAFKLFLDNALLEAVIRTIDALVKAGVLPNP